MKYAVLVGINKYDQPGCDLRGCVNDVMDLRAVLLRMGFLPGNIHTLLDHEASRDAILASLKWLMTAGGEGDDLLIHYSGHGSQVPARDDAGEPDHLSEIICPADMHKHWGDPISDDVLREIFKSKARGTFLTVILDSCHSGHGTRSLDGNGPKSRYLSSPFDLSGYEQVPRNRFGVRQERGYRGVVGDMNHILLAACRSNQTAADAVFAGRPNGAYSFSLLKTLEKFKLHNPTAHEIHLATRLDLRQAGYEQVPVLEGPHSLTDRDFMGGHV